MSLMTIYIFCYLRKDDLYWEMSIKCLWSVIFLTGRSETWNQLLLFGLISKKFPFGSSKNSSSQMSRVFYMFTQNMTISFAIKSFWCAIIITWPIVWIIAHELAKFNVIIFHFWTELLEFLALIDSFWSNLFHKIKESKNWFYFLIFSSHFELSREYRKNRIMCYFFQTKVPFWIIRCALF
jgi:hypothetical protein